MLQYDHSTSERQIGDYSSLPTELGQITGMPDIPLLTCLISWALSGSKEPDVSRNRANRFKT